MTAELPRTMLPLDHVRMSTPDSPIDQAQGGPGREAFRSLRDSPRMAWRRAAFAGPVVLLTLASTALAAVVTAGTGDALRWPLLAVLSINLLFMALTGWPGVLGALLRLRPRPAPAVAEPSGLSRTALVMPVYEEDPAAVFGAIEAMSRAIAEAGLRDIDLFVLSDTQSPVAATLEASSFAALRARLPETPGFPTVRYRRRTRNVRRKVGNIAEFCAEWGHQYDYMVVLDADSLMGPATVRKLIGLMDANPRAGIIQTVPYPVGRETPFARAQQFSARAYTSLLAEGLSFWQGSDANYWGHNAIVRIAPFTTHCELPVLPGREPFGGEILCHDVVEAGLMRAAGWEVWNLPEDTESFESVPANLVDYAVRERRWCQGNLQHLRMVTRTGLRAVGRFHLGYGILTYLAGPLAALFLALGTLDLLLGGGTMPALMRSAGFTGVVLFLIYGFKLVSLAIAMADDEVARGFGGRLRMFGSAGLEQLGCFVSAPVLIVFYTRFVGGMLLGHSVRWDAQPRDDRGVGWAEAWSRMRLPTLVGAAWAVLLALVSWQALAWAAPLWLGLLVSTPASVWSSRAAMGAALRRQGWLTTPEELAPPPVLRALLGARAHPRLPRLRLVVAAAVSSDAS